MVEIVILLRTGVPWHVGNLQCKHMWRICRALRLCIAMHCIAPWNYVGLFEESAALDYICLYGKKSVRYVNVYPQSLFKSLYKKK